jgi:diadenosine tetraphosphate (Ap4A) HIT family hydrolase
MMCIFCKKAFDIIEENDYVYTIYDGFPVTKGHSLIIPKRHVESFFDLYQNEYEAVLEAIQQQKKRLDERYNPDGYNIGVNVFEAAGQTVHHVHIHLIPRYNGDTKNPRGGVRGVIPSKQSY